MLILPLEHNQLMLEAAWLHQPMINGSNGYFPPGHMRILRSLLHDFPAPAALDRIRRLGIRYVVINRPAILEDGSPDWDPARLAQVLALAQTRTLGDYAIADLGQPVTDIEQILNFYAELDRAINWPAYQAPE